MLMIPKMDRARLTHLVGKAATSLISFHLARRGFDSVLTTDSSSAGDLWADFGSGVQSVEVKGAAKNMWAIRHGQAKMVDFYGFVNVADGLCWLVPSSAVEHHTSGRSNAVVSLRQVEGFGGMRLDLGMRTVALTMAERAQGHRQDMSVDGRAYAFRRKTAVVRKTLADGTVKEYRYPATGQL